MIYACLYSFVTIQVAAGDQLRPLFRAIQAAETSGIATPQLAVGDGGRSIGPYQISHAYWTDSRIQGCWKQCRGHAYSEAVMLAYWKRYCPEALRRRNFQTLARIHNGGPNGHVKRTTWGYWRKVKENLVTITASADPGLARSSELSRSERTAGSPRKDRAQPPCHLKNPEPRWRKERGVGLSEGLDTLILSFPRRAGAVR